MTAPFEFATATRILFGRGRVACLAEEAGRLGGCPLLVTGAAADRHRPQLAPFLEAFPKAARFPIKGEPGVVDVLDGVSAARAGECDMVVAVGGGSVIDAGKAIAALLANEGDPMDYLEVVGRGMPLRHRSLPFIAVPATAGTGAEVTRNAVVGVPEKGVKVSLRSALMLPALAIVDPELSAGMPPALTAATGMDALAQLLEPFVSHRANPMTDALCREGLQRVGRSLERAWEAGDDMAAREDMALASLFGGLALANAGLGAVHGFAGPLGGMLGAPHGALCARLLTPVIRANLEAMARREPAHPARQRYREAAQLLTGDQDAAGEDVLHFAARLAGRFAIPGLGQMGLKESHLDEAVAKAAKASSMKGNPLPLLEEELRGILLEAM